MINFFLNWHQVWWNNFQVAYADSGRVNFIRFHYYFQEPMFFLELLDVRLEIRCVFKFPIFSCCFFVCLFLSSRGDQKLIYRLNKGGKTRNRISCVLCGHPESILNCDSSTSRSISISLPKSIYQTDGKQGNWSSAETYGVF